MDHNPWAPTKPGKHGFLQVGLGQDRARFNTPEVRHVFVGAGGHFKYHGKYEITRVDPLSVAEWNTLPEKVKRSYSVTTSIKEKHKKHGNPEQVREKYDKGTLFAPCVFLKCIEFDMEFYNDLVIAATAFVQPKSTFVPASPTESSPQKRKRPASREVNGDAAGEKSSAARNKKARPSVPELDSSPEEIDVTKTRRKSARISQMARNSPAPTGYDSDGGVSSALTYLPAREDD
ncbi:hypothetical protein WOLCODRAFT_62287 [Wolfiporia cocos MD-104 SS10]|uniref:DUF6697 domain-containing protein n=1 Tax=Wolfiporia cocos (strain MD-104) TaxID=742152 RepID=A0A2H3JAX1_WOLCO|nr:hypothetical protein WOLCODRAFT_62287 [Wolfiporia cocos MD-104 SS10]